MKKIVFFIATVLMLSACCECNEMPSEIIQGNASRVIIKPTDSYSRSYRVIKFSYDEHDYIMFLGVESTSIIHNPNCSCKKDQTTDILF